MEAALSNVTPCDLLRAVHRHQGSPEDLVTVVFDDIGADDWATGEGLSATQTGRPRVAHFIAQNAHHQTDAGIPDRHTGLNPRALAVQMDTSDRFLWSGR